MFHTHINHMITKCSFVLPVGRPPLARFPCFIIVQKLTERVAKALPPLIVKTFPHIAVSTHLQQTVQCILKNTEQIFLAYESQHGRNAL